MTYSKERELAKKLLKIKAVFLRPNDPFIWASGIKSPIYCDNRLILTAPDVRDFVEKYLADVIQEYFNEADVIMGTSTAGIAHAAIIGHILKKPMGYVRSSSKDHGRNNKIEGKLEKGDKVVVVEDLISTGGSSIDVVKTLRDFGADVLGVVSIFSYGTKKADEIFSGENCKKISICSANALIDVAVETDYINKEEGEYILKWLKEI